MQHLYEINRSRMSESNDVALRFHRFEKPTAWPEALRQRIFGTIPPDLLQRYPDPTDFYAKLANFLDVSSQNLLLSSGIDEQIKTLLSLTCDPGDRFVINCPSYAMYGVYARIFKLDMLPIIYQPGEFLPPEGFVAQIPSDAKIVFLANPSQPVENCYSTADLSTIAKHCQNIGILLVIDEAYHFFGGPSAIPLTKTFDNVLVMRTFSKAFGAASLRLGYVVGGELTLKPLAAFRLEDEANALSMHAASVLLDSWDTFIIPHIEAIKKSRAHIVKELAELDLKAWGEYGNFVTIDLVSKDHLKLINAGLIDRKIIVKSGFAAPLEHLMLVTCGDIAMSNRFLDAFNWTYLRPYV